METLDTYSRLFYEKQLTQSKQSADEVLPIINTWFQPKTVIDVGCGVGAWLEVWKSYDNVNEIKGIDGSFVDKSLLQIDASVEFLQADLNERLPKLKSYDLAVCLEVVEHLEEKRADTFVEDLTKLSNIIIFSAAIPGQEGTHHVNEQFMSYWIDKFNSHDYKCYDIIRPLIWDKDKIAWWFRQNMVVYVKNGAPLEKNLGEMQTFNCQDLIHKELLKHKINKYNSLVSKKASFNSLLQAILNKITQKFHEKK